MTQGLSGWPWESLGSNLRPEISGRPRGPGASSELLESAHETADALRKDTCTALNTV